MAYFEFIWLERVVRKVAERDLSTEAVEEIIQHPSVKISANRLVGESHSGMLKMDVS